MQKATKLVAASLAGIAAVGAISFSPVRGDIFGSVVKGGLVGVAVKQFAKPINEGVNKLTGSAGASTLDATKVVPIVTLGQGAYVGAVQVSGPQEAVDKVQAVAQLETTLFGGKFRIKALVPINTDSPKGKTIDRVKGVGVSAIIDVKV